MFSIEQKLRSKQISKIFKIYASFKTGYPNLLHDCDFFELLMSLRTFVSKQVLVHNLSYGNEFDLQDIERVT